MEDELIDLETKIENATSESIVHSNIESNITIVCQLINSNIDFPEAAIFFIIKRLKTRNSKIIELTTELLEIATFECGSSFHSHISTCDFLKELENILIRADIPKEAFEKLLNLISKWNEIFTPKKYKFKYFFDFISKLEKKNILINSPNNENHALLDLESIINPIQKEFVKINHDFAKKPIQIQDKESITEVKSNEENISLDIKEFNDENFQQHAEDQTKQFAKLQTSSSKNNFSAFELQLDQILPNMVLSNELLQEITSYEEFKNHEIIHELIANLKKSKIQFLTKFDSIDPENEPLISKTLRMIDYLNETEENYRNKQKELVKKNSNQFYNQIDQSNRTEDTIKKSPYSKYSIATSDKKTKNQKDIIIDYDTRKPQRELYNSSHENKISLPSNYGNFIKNESESEEEKESIVVRPNYSSQEYTNVDNFSNRNAPNIQRSNQYSDYGNAYQDYNPASSFERNPYPTSSFERNQYPFRVDSNSILCQNDNNERFVHHNGNININPFTSQNSTSKSRSVIDTQYDRRGTFFRDGSLRLKLDGNIDQRSKAVKSGEIKLTKSGNIDKRCKAYRDGKIKTKY